MRTLYNKCFHALKSYWHDPVWSKVISAGIIFLFGTLLTSIYLGIQAIVERIPFRQGVDQFVQFLGASTSVNNLFLGVILIVFLGSLLSFGWNLFLKGMRQFRESNAVLNDPNIESVAETRVDPESEQVVTDNLTDSETLQEKLPHAAEPSTDFFAYRIGDAFPGARGLQWFDDPAIAVDRLVILLREPLQFSFESRYSSDPIWRFRDGDSLQIRSFERLSPTKILFFPDEFEIKKIAVYQSARRYKCFVYVETKAEPQIGLYNQSTEEIAESVELRGYCNEEYALFGDIPIQRTEYDDGSAVINGTVVETKGAQLRVRYLSDYNFIITAKESPYNSHKFDEGSGHFLNAILCGTSNPQQFFDYLESFRRQDNPMYLNHPYE
jgi:hypothetical protein